MLRPILQQEFSREVSLSVLFVQIQFVISALAMNDFTGQRIGRFRDSVNGASRWRPGRNRIWADSRFARDRQILRRIDSNPAKGAARPERLSPGGNPGRQEQPAGGITPANNADLVMSAAPARAAFRGWKRRQAAFYFGGGAEGMSGDSPLGGTAGASGVPWPAIFSCMAGVKALTSSALYVCEPVWLSPAMP